MTVTEWRVGSLDVRNKAFNIVSVDGWDSMPGRRGRNVEVPFRHGSFTVPRKFYREKQFALGIIVMPFDSTGAITHAEGGRAHIRENLSTLMGVLYSNTLIPVQRDEPNYPAAGTVTYESLAEVVDLVPVRSNIGVLDRLMIPTFMMPTPFWRVLPEKTGQGVPSVSNGGNAPVTDMVVTFTGGTDPRLTNTTTGEWIELSGTLATPVTVDVGPRTVVQAGSPADALISTRDDHWMQFEPGTNALSLTGGGTVSIDFYDKEF